MSCRAVPFFFFFILYVRGLNDGCAIKVLVVLSIRGLGWAGPDNLFLSNNTRGAKSIRRPCARITSTLRSTFLASMKKTAKTEEGKAGSSRRRCGTLEPLRVMLLPERSIQIFSYKLQASVSALLYPVLPVPDRSATTTNLLPSSLILALMMMLLKLILTSLTLL
jgi:hypothetical protein